AGVASLGVRPTLGMTTCLLETHVFDLKPDLYGQEVVIEFHKFLRPQLKFDGLDALAAQMQADGLDARNHFKRELIPS
ncbi:MAG TPA: riboflavin kinase, partial [Nevskia sp.]|nr:riboflavin kinase [Nevskia sp.]